MYCSFWLDFVDIGKNEAGGKLGGGQWDTLNLIKIFKKSTKTPKLGSGSQKSGSFCLVDFDGAIDLSNEPVTGEEANGTREEEHENCHDYRVTKVENRRRRTLQG